MPTVRPSVGGGFLFETNKRERVAPKQYIFADSDNNSNDNVKKEAVKNDVIEKEMQQNKQQFHVKNCAMKFVEAQGM